MKYYIFINQCKYGNIKINTIDKEQINWEKSKGYIYAHLGDVKLGLDSLVRPYMNAFYLCCVLDTRHFVI